MTAVYESTDSKQLSSAKTERALSQFGIDGERKAGERTFHSFFDRQ